MIRTLMIVLMQFSLLSAAQDKLQFIGEKIDFNINDSRFSTNGIYLFANSTEHEIRQSILFPFSQEADSVFVKRVYNLTYNQSLPFKPIDNGITFMMNVLPKDTVKLNIAYSQKTELVNVYILESTQTWDNPLHRAEYSLTYDDSILIESLSLKPDTIIDNVYYWTKTNFYPKDNLEIRIKSTLVVP